MEDDEIEDSMEQPPEISQHALSCPLANGEPLKCQGIFENVPIMLQGIPFILTLYALPLIGLDLVLGVHWLAQLGTVTCNWKKLTMEFQWDDKNKKLQGIDTFNPTCNYESHHQGSMARRSMFVVSLQPVADSTPSNVEPKMRQSLQKFDDVFQGPTQLPPTREVDHHINLKEGIEPINVQPYRYAYFQKAEIE